MRKSLSASVLLLVLCCPTFAGDMLTPPVAPPPQPATTSTSVAPSSGGEVADPAPVDDSTAQDVSVTQLAVSIFESLLAIL